MKFVLYFFALLCFTSNTLSQVNTEKFRVSTDSLGLSVRSDIDLTLMAGNTDFAFLGTNTRFNYNWGMDYTFLVINGGLGINKGESFFSQAFFHLRNVNTLSDVISLEEFVQYDNNKQILLLDRALLGIGTRIKHIENDDVIIRIGPSIFYEHENFDLDNSSNHKKRIDNIRLSLYFTSLFNIQKNISFLSIAYLQPKSDNLKDIKILFDSALNFSLGKAVDFVVKLLMRYDSIPADGIEEFDLSMKMGLAINL